MCGGVEEGDVERRRCEEDGNWGEEDDEKGKRTFYFIDKVEKMVYTLCIHNL